MWIYFVINPSLAIGIGDPVASVGRLALSFTGRSFRKSKTTLARAPIAGKVSKFSDLQGKAVLFGRVGNLVRSPL